MYSRSACYQVQLWPAGCSGPKVSRSASVRFWWLSNQSLGLFWRLWKIPFALFQKWLHLVFEPKVHHQGRVISALQKWHQLCLHFGANTLKEKWDLKESLVFERIEQQMDRGGQGAQDWTGAEHPTHSSYITLRWSHLTGEGQDLQVYLR